MHCYTCTYTCSVAHYQAIELNKTAVQQLVNAAGVSRITAVSAVDPRVASGATTAVYTVLWSKMAIRQVCSATLTYCI
jgi:hypothetical protein